KWRIGFTVVLLTFVVLLIVGLANYLSCDYSRRYYLSSRTRMQLSPRTLALLGSITNQVKAIIYYDKNDPMYSSVLDLLNQYNLANKRITTQTVDFLRDPGAAQKVKTDYKLGAVTDKNLVIFDCQGRSLPVSGTSLAEYALERVQGETDAKVRTKPVAFKGEMMFTAVLLAVTNPKPLKACFLT